jgi:hypothetical protein
MHARNLDHMLDEEVTRLSELYQGEVKPEEPGLLRVAGPLGLNLATSIALGDEIVDDLDKAIHGIGWWKAYLDLDQQTRILLSDYLAACARAIPDNLVEAQVERLELDNAAEDFRQWLSRGVTAGERSTVEPPRVARMRNWPPIECRRTWLASCEPGEAHSTASEAASSASLVCPPIS